MRAALSPILSASLVACGPSPGRGPDIRPGDPRFAVVRTDYESTAIATLDDRGEVLAPALISSGSAQPGLVAALSGDVVLGRARPSHPLLVVDRLGTDVVTQVDPWTGEVRGQIRVAPESSDFSSNPQDAVELDGGLALVSRFETNRDPAAVGAKRANDLLEIDLTRSARTGRRLDLTPMNGVATLDDGTEAPAWARPSGMAVLPSGDVVVGLALLTPSFDGAAPGAVALVDPEDLSAVRIPLSDQVRNCGSVEPLPPPTTGVLVGCSGFAVPFGEESTVRRTSALLVLEAVGDGLEVARQWRAGPNDPVAVYEACPLGDRFALAVDYGEVGGEPDRAYLIDLGGGSPPQLVLTAEGPFTLGQASLDPDTGLVLIPERSDRRPVLHRLRWDGAALSPADTPIRFTDGPLPPTATQPLR